MTWRGTNLALVVAMLVLWAAAALTGWIGSTIFIGHVSMLALVLAALSAWRSDVPLEEEEDS